MMVLKYLQQNQIMSLQNGDFVFLHAAHGQERGWREAPCCAGLPSFAWNDPDGYTWMALITTRESSCIGTSAVFVFDCLDGGFHLMSIPLTYHITSDKMTVRKVKENKKICPPEHPSIVYIIICFSVIYLASKASYPPTFLEKSPFTAPLDMHWSLTFRSSRAMKSHTLY